MNISNRNSKRILYVIGMTYIGYLYVKESALQVPCYVWEWCGMYSPAILSLLS